MTKKSVILAIVTAVALLVIVISSTFWLLRQTLPGEEDLEYKNAVEEPGLPVDEEPVEEEVEPETTGAIRVTLFYLSSSGRMFSLEERDIPFSNSLQDQAKQVLRQLLAGSKRGRGSAIPSGVRLRGLFITQQGLAYVDLSQELITNHPGGTCAEELTVYSLANTLISNFPAVKKVQILVEGREIQSLAGHLDLTRPYGRGPSRLEPS